MSEKWLADFIKESNKIEGIMRKPLESEIRVHELFLEIEKPTVGDLENVVNVIAAARIRDKFGMDVYVGNHLPQKGGPNIIRGLEEILSMVRGSYEPYQVHVAYETLHPFMDGNGRSGRLLWLWMMEKAATKQKTYHRELGFLHCWYYQSLENSR